MCKRFRLGVGFFCDVSPTASSEEHKREPGRPGEEQAPKAEGHEERLRQVIREELRAQRSDVWYSTLIAAGVALAASGIAIVTKETTHGWWAVGGGVFLFLLAPFVKSLRSLWCK